MITPEVLAELQAFGTERTRAVHRRHGVGENMYGVSYAALGALQKKIKRDHALAQQLWATGNHDARILATMVADPKQADTSLLAAWAAELDNYVITDAFSGFISKTPLARQRMEDWTRSEEEWIGRAGWQLLARVAMADKSLPDEYFEGYLDTIERTIHSSKNRVRDAMNAAMIAIGLRSDALEEKAIAAARRIGKVEVDHGETDCTTPDAEPYIRKARKRRG